MDQSRSEMTPLRALIALGDRIASAPVRGALAPGETVLPRKVAELEASLGVPLLANRGRGIALTPAAQELIGYAQRVLPELSTGSPGCTSALVPQGRERRFIVPQSDAGSGELVEQAMTFVAGLTKARSSLFYWVGPDYQMVDARLHNIEPHLLARYNTEMCRFDPLYLRRHKSEGRLIGVLSVCFDAGFERADEYRGYCHSVGVGDEIDLLFWRNGQPFACLAMFRGPDDPPFSLDDMDWEALRRYVQASLRMHWRVRSDEVETILVERFGLYPRELDVVELIVCGKSNADIADILEISVATVKVHVANILKKLGVDSRLAVACVINRLQQS